MSGTTVEEDAIDEILYLSRVNEVTELAAYISQLSQQTKHSKPDLVAAAVDPYSKNSALHYAAANGHIDVIKLLLSFNTDKATTSAPGLINAANDAGNTALHWAALNGHLGCVKLLVQSGADVTIINKAGHDAVFEAEINDKKEVVEWLLGAVEDLEKGIGQTGGSSADGDQEGGDAMEETDKNTTSNGASATGVEDLRKGMEGLETGNGTSQGG